MKPIIIILLSVVLVTSCKKETGVIKPTISVRVINASPGVPNAKISTVYTGYYSQITGVNYGASFVYTLPSSSTPVKVVSSTDTATLLYDENIQGSQGDIFSLFIAGIAGEDVILHKDNLPIYINNHSGTVDSSIGVRFINLSYNSGPVNVTLSTSTTNEFSSVAYKGITDFKKYSAGVASPPSYSFTVTDAIGNVIASSSSLDRNTLRFKNVTLVLTGMIGGSGSSAPGVLMVNNF